MKTVLKLEGARRMNARPKYKTKQRDRMISYLETVPGQHITAFDVCEAFRQDGAPIGQSTVYRQLESLVGEGILNKYIIDEKSPACFEYVRSASHQGPGTCFHCKCEKCGRLIHLHCEELEEIRSHLLGEHGFRLDPRRTVFYGICEACQQAEG